jgi:hypothetical protein
LAGARRLHGGIESQNIGLKGDLIDGLGKPLSLAPIFPGAFRPTFPLKHNDIRRYPLWSQQKQLRDDRLYEYPMVHDSGCIRRQPESRRRAGGNVRNRSYASGSHLTFGNHIRSADE